MTEEVLSSNVLNYLVWRYLQEQGYAGAALQLMHAWCPNPDELPFAKNIHTRTLVQLVQCGLAFDGLSAKVSGQTRKFRFGHDHGPPNPLQPAVRRAMEERVSRSELPYYPSQHRLLNAPVTPLPFEDDGLPKHAGDAMDVDASVMDDQESDMDITLLNAATPPPSTGDAGVNASTQCDQPLDLVERTVLLDLGSNPTASVANIRWNDGDSRIITVFAGSRMSHFFVSQPNDLFAQLFTTRTFEGPGFEITRVCWTDGEDCVVYGVDRRSGFDRSDSDAGLLEKVWYIGGGGMRIAAMASYMGLVMASRWNNATKTLLSVSATLSSTTVRFWSDLGSLPQHKALSLPTTCYDATWVSPTRFVLCCEQGLELYETGAKEGNADEATPAHRVKSLGGSFKWESVEYDSHSGLLGLVSFEDNAVGVIDAGLEGPVVAKAYEDGRITSFAFQPSSEPLSVRAGSKAEVGEPKNGTQTPRVVDEDTTMKDTDDPVERNERSKPETNGNASGDGGKNEAAEEGMADTPDTEERINHLVAVGLDSGVVDILFLDGLVVAQTAESSKGRKGELVPVRRMCMPGVGAYAIAFSPNGQSIAAAGLNCVLIWDLPPAIASLQRRQAQRQQQLQKPQDQGRDNGESAQIDGLAATMTTTTTTRPTLVTDNIPRAEWRWGLDKSGRWTKSGHDLGEMINGAGAKSGLHRQASQQPNGDVEGPATPAATTVLSDREAEMRHELKWDKDGKKLAFALDGQVAVIQIG